MEKDYSVPRPPGMSGGISETVSISTYRIFHASIAPAAFYIQVPNRFQRDIGNIVPMITHEKVFFNIGSVRRNIGFFHETATNDVKH
jgi:hypothetical protein